MNKLDQKLKDHFYGVKSGVKTMPFQLKDIDTRARTVSGYFAAFDSIDADQDIIRRGAFAKSILEHGPDSSTNRQIAHLRNHDWDRQIGKIFELGEDDKGLFFRSSMGTSTEGDNAFRDYQEGILVEHSIGFNYIPDKINFVEDIRTPEGGFFEVTEVKLWEGSGVTFGSNSLTPVIDVSKGETNYNATLKRLNELSGTFQSAIKNGKGTDGRLINLEVQFKQIQQLINSLENQEPSIKDTLKGEPKTKSFLDTLIEKSINHKI